MTQAERWHYATSATLSTLPRAAKRLRCIPAKRCTPQRVWHRPVNAAVGSGFVRRAERKRAPCWTVFPIDHPERRRLAKSAQPAPTAAVGTRRLMSAVGAYDRTQNQQRVSRRPVNAAVGAGFVRLAERKRAPCRVVCNASPTIVRLRVLVPTPRESTFSVMFTALSS
jgi:hypothetical protein